jgi:hypothetical protein
MDDDFKKVDEQFSDLELNDNLGSLGETMTNIRNSIELLIKIIKEQQKEINKLKEITNK